ncbi:MAG: hypothetical protein WCX65_16435 [bacterium]
MIKNVIARKTKADEANPNSTPINLQRCKAPMLDVISHHLLLYHTTICHSERSEESSTNINRKPEIAKNNAARWRGAPEMS